MSVTSIIIPVYNALESARKCLESLYRAATRVPFEVIVVDNGSSAAVTAWLSEQKRRHPELIALRFDHPLGFAKAVNEGAKCARGDYLVILNSDCAVTAGWLDGLGAVLDAHPRIGIVSPVTNHSGPGIQLASGPSASHAPIGEPRRLFFFCVMIRRELWGSLGGLDEIYGLGTYEDDDFCLRARLAGWSMAVVPTVFVWNEASRTFDDNRIDRDEWLFRNETIFLEKASWLSKMSVAPVSGKASVPSTSVLIAAPPGAGCRLADSLNSLANQTVTGFEIVVACAPGEELNMPTGLRRITAEPASLWNAAIAAARAEFIAFLPAGDIWLPYHLEMLHRRLRENLAVHSGWSMAIHSPGRAERAPARTFEDPAKHLLIAPWAPLVSWMYHRASLPDLRFREDLHSFADWDFAIRLSHSTNAGFEPGITCEHNRWRHDAQEDARDAELVMESFPVEEQWAVNERLDFLRAVQSGIWEESMIIKRREREYRARRLFRQKMTPPCPIEEARRKLAAVQKCSARSNTLDFIFLNIIRWDDLTQRPHHFATRLAKRGHRVFWIDVSFHPAEDFTGIVSTQSLAESVLAVRLPGLRADIYHLAWTPPLLDLAADSLGQLRDSAGISRAVQLVNFPGWTPLAKILRDRFAWPILYDCLDDQYAFGELHGQDIAAYEAEITQTCDALVTSGHLLRAKKLITREDTVFIPNAADYELFGAAASQGLLDHLRPPIIGFFGGRADWLDTAWIAEAVRRFPSFTFVFVGSECFAREEALQHWRYASAAPNVVIFPQGSFAKLAAYLAQFDVCIVPFQDLPITRAMNTVKVYEYLAAGKHILAPALPEMQRLADLGLLFTYRDREESFRLLEMLATHPPTQEQMATRTAFAAQNDWNERVDRLIEVVDRLPKSVA